MRRKYIFCVLSLTLLTTPLVGCPQGRIKTLDISGRGLSIDASPDGGFLLVAAQSFDFDTPVIYKLSPSLETEWFFAFDEPTQVWGGYGVNEDTGGSIHQLMPSDEEQEYEFHSGTARLELLALDASGEIVWNRRYGDESWLSGALIQTADGDAVVLGTGVPPYLLMKIDGNDGEMLWSQVLESFGQIGATPDGGILVRLSETLIKMDGEGQETWRVEIDPLDSLPDGSFRTTFDGGAVIAGTVPTEQERVDQVPAVWRADANGAFLWARSDFTNDGPVPEDSIVEYATIGFLALPDGTLALVVARSQTALVSNRPVVSFTVCLFRLDSDGNVLWTTDLPGDFAFPGGALDFTDAGGIIMLGSSGGLVAILEIDGDGNVLRPRS